MTTAVAHKLAEKPRTDDVLINENVNFEGLLLSEPILKGLKSAGFERPSPIQLKAIPLGRCGLDLIVQAKSGTGKTCVFSVIALEGLQLDTSALQVLVLAPTREIAIQIWDVIKSIGQALPQLKCHTFIGGMPLQEDKQKLKKCHIAVGTPGRIKQLIEQGVMNIENIRMFVLDEADKLLEDSFQEQINWIYSTLPDNKQMLALSATYPEYLAEHLTAYMRNPTFLRLNVSDPALLGIRQYYKSVKYHPLPNKLFESKVEVVTTILSSVEFQQCLVFSNLQTMAQNMADALNAKGWPTACIAGSLDQKDRNLAMSKLKTFKCRVLISTDLTSRGIDADKVNLVINLDVPKDHETYLHRIGRAGRFGTFGACVSIVSEGQEMVNLQAVEKRCNTCISALPDPIPVDLVKTQGMVSLDDMVSTEKIFTDKESSYITPVNKLASQRGFTGSSKSEPENKEQFASEKNTVNISISEKSHTKSRLTNGSVEPISVLEGNQATEISQDEVITAIESLEINKKSSLGKNNGNIKSSQGKAVNKDDISFLENIKRQHSAMKSESKKPEKLVNGNIEQNGPTKTAVDKVKQDKDKSKKHTTANFWTQLINERNDDEEFVQEFQDSLKSDDRLHISTKKTEPEINVKKLEKVEKDSDNVTNEPLKRKTAKRTNDDQQKKSSDTKPSVEISKTKTPTVQNLNDIKIRIPSLKETIRLNKLQTPHTYESAVESCKLHRDINQKVPEQVEKLQMTETKPDNIVKIKKALKYDKDLLHQVRKILEITPIKSAPSSKIGEAANTEISTSKLVSSLKVGELAKIQGNDSESRKTIKATRSARKPFKQAAKSKLSIQQQEGIDIQPVTKAKHFVEPVDYSYLEDSITEFDKLNLDDEKKCYSKQKFGRDDVSSFTKRKLEKGDRKEWRLPKMAADTNVDLMSEQNRKPVQTDSVFEDYTAGFRAGGNKKYENFFSESEISSDSSESSEESDYRRNRDKKSGNYQSRQKPSKSTQGRQFDKLGDKKSRSRSEGTRSKLEREFNDFDYHYEENQHYPEDEESDSDNSSPQNLWEEYMKNYYQNFPNHQHTHPNNFPQHPFMNPYSYMNGYTPFGFPWQNPYLQHQQTWSTYQSLYQNLEMQQQYIKMMLKSYKKMMPRE